MSAAVAERTVVKGNPRGDEADPIFEVELYDTTTGGRIGDRSRFDGRSLVIGQLEGRLWPESDYATRIAKIHANADRRHGVTPKERAQMPVDGWNDGSFITRHIRRGRG